MEIHALGDAVLRGSRVVEAVTRPDVVTKTEVQGIALAREDRLHLGGQGVEEAGEPVVVERRRRWIGADEGTRVAVTREIAIPDVVAPEPPAALDAERKAILSEVARRRDRDFAHRGVGRKEIVNPRVEAH